MFVNSSNGHACQKPVLTTNASVTQAYAVLPPVNGETYSPALIDFAQLPQQQQLLVAAAQQVHMYKR